MSHVRFVASLLGFSVIAVLGGCAAQERILVDPKTAHAQRIVSLAFSGDDKELAYSSGDWTKSPGSADAGTIHVATLASEPELREIDIAGCSFGNLYTLAWSHKRHSLAVAARDAIYLYTEKGERFVPNTLLAPKKACSDPQGPTEIASLVWSPDDALVAFATLDRSIQVLAVAGGDPATVYTGEQPVTLLSWSQQGLLVREGKEVLSIDTESKQKITRFAIPDDADSISATPKGTLVLITAKGDVQEVHGSGAPHTIHHVKAHLALKGNRTPEPGRHRFRIGVSASGRVLAVAEGMGDNEDSGVSLLALVPLPNKVDDDVRKKKAAPKPKAAPKGDDDEAPTPDSAAGGDEANGDSAPADDGEARAKPTAKSLSKAGKAGPKKSAPAADDDE